MSLQDPISDMISRIKNAQSRGHPKVSFGSSKLKKGTQASTHVKFPFPLAYSSRPCAHDSAEAPNHVPISKIEMLLSLFLFVRYQIEAIINMCLTGALRIAFL